MKISKTLFLAILSITLSNNIQGMDYLWGIQVPEWIKNTIDCIVGKNVKLQFSQLPSEVRKELQFSQLPSEVQNIVITMAISGGSQSIEEAAQVLNQLSLVNKAFNQALKTPQVCSYIVDSLAKKFNQNSWKVEMELFPMNFFKKQFVSVDIPEDMKVEKVVGEAESFEKAINNINDFAQNNEQFKILMNNAWYCRQLVTFLADKFNQRHDLVTSLLPINKISQEAIYAIHTKLFNILIRGSVEDLKKYLNDPLISENIDVNFVFSQGSPILIAFMAKNNWKEKIKILIEKGSMPNFMREHWVSSDVVRASEITAKFLQGIDEQKIKLWLRTMKGHPNYGGYFMLRDY